MSTDIVPAFPNFRMITIDDKDIFDSYLTKDKRSSSEYTFTNFFTWRDCDHSQITKINQNICVLATDIQGGQYFFEPMGNTSINDTIQICADYLHKCRQQPRFSRLTSSFIAQFKNKNNFIIEQDRDNFDYIYLTEDLIRLKGKHYDGKRNRIKKFIYEYGAKHQYKPLTLHEIPGCIELLARWKSEKKGLCIDEPVREILNNYSTLELKGSIVIIEGKVKAFTIGEKLTNETAVIYVEIAEPKYIGLSQYINQRFCEEWADCKYINREQDMGDAGMKRAKSSYYPYRFIEKYNMLVKELS